jgi:hypothetical protein
LDAKVKELQSFMGSELLNQLGISQDLFMKLEADKISLLKVGSCFVHSNAVSVNKNMSSLAGLSDMHHF